MRRFLLFIAPAFALATFSFACEDDPSANPSTEFPEAGSFDANRPPTDGNTPLDAQPDAPVGPKGVTVIVTGLSGPKSGITVVFHDATGAMLETKTTGADGKATSTPTNATAMATAALGGDLNRHLFTWTGVEDGDELPALIPEEATLANLQVTLPGQVDAGDGQLATYYAQVGGCRTNGTNIGNEPLALFIEPYCFRGAGAIFVEARDPSDTVVARSSQKPIAFPFDGGAANVTGLPAFAAPSSVAVQVTGNSGNLGNGVARLDEIANSTYFTHADYAPLQDSGNGTTYEHVYKTSPAAFVEALNASVRFPGAFGATRTVGKRTAFAATVALDANGLPTEITETSIDQTNRRRPILKWTGGTTGMRGGVARINFFDGAAQKATVWTIVVPATAAQVTAPALPASLDSLLPDGDADTSWNGQPEVAFADSSLLVAGYATFRKVQGAVLPRLVSDDSLDEIALPANGDYKVTHFNPNLGK